LGFDASGDANGFGGDSGDGGEVVVKRW